MSIAETREELVESIQEQLTILMVPVRMAKVGHELEEVTAWLEALGICNLLLYADADRFYENLIRSGHTRRHFLRKCRDEGNVDDYQLAISRWDSFLDVVVTGDFALAREIVTLSVDDWVRTGEYEDDFCCRHFLHRFVMPPSPERDLALKATLDRWRSWLGVLTSNRLECCVALRDRDDAGFAAAFDALIVERQSKIAKDRKTPLAADIGFEPRSHVYIEGLALLKLASRLGFALRTDYPMCPALAHLHPTKPWPEDVYPMLEAEQHSPP